MKKLGYVKPAIRVSVEHETVRKLDVLDKKTKYERRVLVEMAIDLLYSQFIEKGAI